jgi:hypothetical protein
LVHGAELNFDEVFEGGRVEDEDAVGAVVSDGKAAEMGGIVCAVYWRELREGCLGCDV